MNDIKYQDDFEWQNVYPVAHYTQTQQLEQEFLFELPPESHIQNGKVVIPPQYNKDIHINHRLIFETIIEKQPESIFEVGFGYANNLYGIHLLLPHIKIYGCDISYKQHYMALQRYPECENFNLAVEDFLNLEVLEDSFDFVFSQAVLMHMSTQRAMLALEKMVKISKKWIMSTDGGLKIPNIRSFIQQFGKTTFYDDIAEKYWTCHSISPFLIEKE